MAIIVVAMVETVVEIAIIVGTVVKFPPATSRNRIPVTPRTVESSSDDTSPPMHEEVCACICLAFCRQLHSPVVEVTVVISTVVVVVVAVDDGQIVVAGGGGRIGRCPLNYPNLAITMMMETTNFPEDGGEQGPKHCYMSARYIHYYCVFDWYGRRLILLAIVPLLFSIFLIGEDIDPRPDGPSMLLVVTRPCPVDHIGTKLLRFPCQNSGSQRQQR
ncbi:unnamed protein product [Brugia pahangi]|uniref:Secreted protein n=1 Tax=Brugia pahangi TaxID=6280 RepID=A0A0N4T1L8_BRUPA|nr:unnamed protein product [Brugia pahangi]